MQTAMFGMSRCRHQCHTSNWTTTLVEISHFLLLAESKTSKLQMWYYRNLLKWGGGGGGWSPWWCRGRRGCGGRRGWGRALGMWKKSNLKVVIVNSWGGWERINILLGRQPQVRIIGESKQQPNPSLTKIWQNSFQSHFCSLPGFLDALASLKSILFSHWVTE